MTCPAGPSPEEVPLLGEGVEEAAEDDVDLGPAQRSQSCCRWCRCCSRGGGAVVQDVAGGPVLRGCCCHAAPRSRRRARRRLGALLAASSKTKRRAPRGGCGAGGLLCGGLRRCVLLRRCCCWASPLRVPRPSRRWRPERRRETAANAAGRTRCDCLRCAASASLGLLLRRRARRRDRTPWRCP